MRMEVNMCYLECVCVHACMHVHLVRVQLFTTPFTVAFQAPCPWNFPGKNTRVGCHLLLQGIFPTQGLNPRLLLSPALAGRFFTTGVTWEASPLKNSVSYWKGWKRKDPSGDLGTLVLKVAVQRDLENHLLQYLFVLARNVLEPWYILVLICFGN